MTQAAIPRLRPIETEGEVRRCFELMRQLRPHLASADEFAGRWRRQAGEGYRLTALYAGAEPIALAGWRVQENLVHGRFLYVDDLVTDESRRGRRLGAHLIGHLREQAAALGCARLLLDTPLANSLGQRFYFRMGLLATALRFTTSIAPAP